MDDVIHVNLHNVILYDEILHDEISPSNCIYMQCLGYESQSSPCRSREQRGDTAELK